MNNCKSEVLPELETKCETTYQIDFSKKSNNKYLNVLQCDCYKSHQLCETRSAAEEEIVDEQLNKRQTRSSTKRQFKAVGKQQTRGVAKRRIRCSTKEQITHYQPTKKRQCRALSKKQVMDENESDGKLDKKQQTKSRVNIPMIDVVDMIVKSSDEVVDENDSDAKSSQKQQTETNLIKKEITSETDVDDCSSEKCQITASPKKEMLDKNQQDDKSSQKHQTGLVKEEMVAEKDVDDCSFKKCQAAASSKKEVMDESACAEDQIPGRLYYNQSGDFRMTLSAHKSIILTQFKDKQYAYMWSVDGRYLILTLDELNALLENRNKIYCIVSLLKNNEKWVKCLKARMEG